jgi:hypothetical protein
VSPRRIIERERRWAGPVAVAAVLPIGLFVASLFARAGVELPDDTLFPSFFRAVDAHAGAWVASGVLQGLALALLALPLTYLFLAAEARADRMLRPLVAFCVLGPLLVGAQAALNAVAQAQAASEFVAQSPGVGDVYTLASDVFEDESLRTIAGSLGAGGALSLVFAMVYTPLWASRTGLVTRFYGTMGMALGASLLFPPLLQLALPLLLGWFAYLGLLVMGRLRRGRPPAWETGKAEPWPAAGEEPEAAPEPAATVEGDASEIPGVGEGPAPARSSSSRRKRKRRRS